MKFVNSFLENTELLLEKYKLSDAKKDFLATGKISKKDFDKILKSDPSKNKTYTYWVIDNYLNDKSHIKAKIDEVIELVILFDRFRSNFKPNDRDIYTYEYSILRARLSYITKYGHFGKKDFKKKTRHGSALIDDNTHVVWKKGKNMILVPSTQFAAHYWLEEYNKTKLPVVQNCVTHSPASLKEDRLSGFFFIFIFPDEPIQFHRRFFSVLERYAESGFISGGKHTLCPYSHLYGLDIKDFLKGKGLLSLFSKTSTYEVSTNLEADGTIYYTPKELKELFNDILNNTKDVNGEDFLGQDNLNSYINNEEENASQYGEYISKKYIN